MQGTLEAEADSRFAEILTLDGIDLTDSRAYFMISRLFKDGAEFPEFFNEDPDMSSRTIKELQMDPHSNLRVIYFEVLRLAAESDDDTFLINLRRRVFSPEFNIMFSPESDSNREIFCDYQFKRFFAEFLTIFQQRKDIQVDELIHQYPIMDQVFIHILRTILVLREVNESFQTRIPSEVVFSTFGKELGLDIISYGNCWKFEDADMVCYQGPNLQLYLVYTAEQMNQITKTTTQDILQDPPTLNRQYSISVTQEKNKILPATSSTPTQITYIPPIQAYVSEFSEDPILPSVKLQSKQTSTPIQTNTGAVSQNQSSSRELPQGVSYSSSTFSYQDNKDQSSGGYGGYDLKVNTYEPYIPSYSYSLNSSSPYGNTSSFYETSKYQTSNYNPTSYNMTNYDDIYKIDEKVNSLVDKYLNIKPQDVIGSTFTSNYYSSAQSPAYIHTKLNTDNIDTLYSSYNQASGNSYAPSTKYDTDFTSQYKVRDYTDNTYSAYTPETTHAPFRYQSYEGYSSDLGAIGGDLGFGGSKGSEYVFSSTKGYEYNAPSFTSTFEYSSSSEFISKKYGGETIGNESFESSRYTGY